MADCLVLMSFRKELDSHFLLIKDCGERLGFTVYRVDSHRFSGNIVEAIAKALSNADLIVADLTGNNPNVMYELAIAHSLGKKVLIVTDDRNAIPFDVATYRAEIIDPDSPENCEELFRAMKDLVSSVQVTGPLGGQLIYGQNLAVSRIEAFGIDSGPFLVGFFVLAYLLGWDRALSDELVFGGLVALMLSYLLITTWVLGCTLGQRFLGLKVTTLNGDKPSFAQCVGRVGLSNLLVPLSYGMTFFWALKGPGYRAVHDIATGTMIVRR